MALSDYEILREYRNKQRDIISSFYLPLMSSANLYQRAVGFFSSSALSFYTLGISKLIENGGKIELIASPQLSDEDIEAIELGYEYRDDVIQRALIDSLKAPLNKYEEKRLNLLATYIADEKLEIKIGFVQRGNKLSIYHEKLGLLYDAEGNIVAFTGSMNESGNGFVGNYETIDAYCSWKLEDSDRVEDKVKAFSAIWNNEDPGVLTIRFPEVEKHIIEKYKKPEVQTDIDEEEYEIDVDDFKEIVKVKNRYEITISFDDLYDYQNKAIEVWEDNNYIGIYDMCTGAGKTYTAIGSIKKLHEANKGRLAVVIVAPYQHLVEQWVEDLVKYNITPIVGYSDSKYRKYKEQLRKQIFDYNLGVKQFICFICTNASFKIDKVQSLLSRIKDNVLLVVDEAHNFGSAELRNILSEKYDYRLALSATLDRHGDPEGTEALYRFFKTKCIEYTLEQAIKDKKLTEYYYHPYIVTLTPSELDDYIKLTNEMRQYIRVDKNGNIKPSKQAEKIAIQRARIVAGAFEKIGKLKELIEPYKKDHNLLVYCGATTLNSDDLIDEGIDEDIRQIDYITKVLGDDLGMNVSQFTSREDMPTRSNLIERFKKAEELQGLIAIKCLDEGVNIPSIKTAFILASTTNPKEYIQRRGRVLRTYEGKDYARIYDLITVPRPLDEAFALSSDEISTDISLIKNEINRMIEFKKLSLNPYDADKIINELIDAYGLEPDEDFMDIEEYHFS